jgi:predicted DNA-binding transcriptional regulator YafY
MRADRLVAIVLLLQVHGQLTAPDLAERLEVSERTVRRDLDSLCVAGVPLYAQRGRGGGWALLGGHRIDLTGLTADEVEALSMVTSPGNLAGAGAVGAEVEAAMRKVLAALPEPLRLRVAAARKAVLVDPTGWGRTAEPSAHLDALRAAVLGGEQVDVRYAPPGRPAEDRRLHPLGLVCKRGVWYLVAVAPAGLRTYRLSRVQAVTTTGLPAERPEGFDLASAWADVEARLRDRFVGIEVDLTVSSRAEGLLQATLQSWSHVTDLGGGRWRVSMPSAEAAARELAAFGDEVEVCGPVEVRVALAAIGARLVERYAPLPVA